MLIELKTIDYVIEFLQVPHKKIYNLRTSSAMWCFVCWTNKLIKITLGKPKHNTMKV